MRTRALLFCPAVAILLASSPLHAVTIHDWSRTPGGASVATDAAGNVVITGALYGTVDFGGGPLTASGFLDVFVAKYDVDGNHVWSKQFGDDGEQSGDAVAVDGSGNIAISGHFTGVLNFGGGPLASTGFDYDVFVAKLDPDGNHIWSKRFDSDLYGMEVYCRVAADAAGNVVLAEEFVGTVDFGGGPLMCAGGLDFAVAKFDPSGNHLWSKRFGDADNQFCQSTAMDALGNVVVTGYFAGTIDFGGGPLTSLGDNIFLAEFDAAGNHLWSSVFGGEYSWHTAHAQSVATDIAGNVVITGYFNNTVDFGGGTLTAVDFGLDIFVAKFDAIGNHLWSQNFGDSDYQNGQSVATDMAGNIYVTGHFWGTVDFGGGVLTASPFFEDVFIVKLAPNGSHQWSQNFGSDYNDRGLWVAGHGDGNFVATGFVAGPVSFGGGPIGPGSFLVRFADEGPIPVLISRFDASVENGAARITWDVQSDEELESYTLYRRDDARAQSIAIAEESFDTGTRSYVDTSVRPGKTYSYELSIRTPDGGEFRSAVATVTVPRLQTALGQNYPNPFRPATSIEYSLGERSNAVVGIYDAAGRLVARLDQGAREAGTYRAEWDGRDTGGNVVGSGVYFYRLEGVPNVAPKKMVRLK